MNKLSNSFRDLDISKIIPDENQPRQYFDVEELQKLSDSIKDKGILNPIVVECVGRQYLIIDGERRFKSAILLGLKIVPVKILEGNFSNAERNVLRFHYQETQKQWSVVEKAEAIKEIKESLKLTARELWHALSISQSTISRYLSLFDLSKTIRQKITKYKVSFSFAEQLAIINRQMPMDISMKYPDYVDIIINRNRDGSMTTYKGLYILKRFIRDGEYELIDEFLSNSDCDLLKLAKRSGYLEKHRFDSIKNRTIGLLKELKIINKNDYTINDDIKLSLSKLANEISNLK